MSLLTPLLIAYAVVGLLVARALGGHFVYAIAESFNDPKPDAFDLIFGSLGGIAAGLLWPLAPIGLFVVTVFPRCLPSIVIGAEARSVARRREARVAELERELDLR